MALRDQPYLPLYVQDIMTDEKLNYCSAATHGIYIKGIMCLMHKSEAYGKILLKQNFKQTESTSLNFANQLFKQLPYSPEELKKAIEELLQEEVCYLEGDYLCQKRMIKDNHVSEARSRAGKKGGGNPNFVKTKPLTKRQTNTEYEYEYENEDLNTSNTIKEEKKFEKIPNPNMVAFGKEEILKELLSSEMWMQDLCRLYKQDITKLPEKITDWIDEQALKEKLDRTLKELKGHFINTLKIEISKEKKENKNGNENKYASAANEREEYLKNLGSTLYNDERNEA